MKQKILDLIIAAERTDPETGSFAEWLAEYLVANGVTVHEWIPVKERLPTKEDATGDGMVLAITASGYTEVRGYPFVSNSYHTHWMPIPKAPGKDGE